MGLRHASATHASGVFDSQRTTIAKDPASPRRPVLTGHLTSNTETNAWIRSRPRPFLKNVLRNASRHGRIRFPSPTGRLRGQRPQLQKNRGARATTLGPQIRNDYAGKFTSRRGLGTYFAKSLEQRTGFYLGDSTRWRTSAGARQRAPSRRETSRSREAGKLPSGLGSG